MSKKASKSNNPSVIESASQGATVVVSSLTPPFLNSCNSILSVALFEEKFKMYEMRGGTLHFRECLGDVILLRISRVLSGRLSQKTDEEILEALYEVYKPVEAYDLLAVLRGVKCSMDARSVSIDALIKYLVLFTTVVEKAKDVPVNRDEVFNIFIRGLQNEDFGHYLVSSGLKVKPVKEWLDFAVERAEVFRRAQVICQGSSNKAKKFSSARSEPNPVVASSGPSVAKSVGLGVSTPVVAEQQIKRVWDRDVCLGCGHVSNPPHRRVNCPHKHLSGWRLKGPPPVPPLPGVALVAKGVGDVCLVQGLVRGVSARIGLDTMSTYSLVSREFLSKLAPVRVFKGENLWRVSTAGGGLVDVEEFVRLEVEVEGAPPMSFVFGLMDVPVDVLVGWNDVKGSGLWSWQGGGCAGGGV